MSYPLIVRHPAAHCGTAQLSHPCAYKGKPTIFSKNVLPFPEMAQRFTPSHSDYPLSSPGPPAPSPAPFWGKGSPAGSTTERSLMFCFCFTFLHQESGQHPKIQKQKSLSGGRSARENSTKPNPSETSWPIVSVIYCYLMKCSQRNAESNTKHFVS